MRLLRRALLLGALAGLLSATMARAESPVPTEAEMRASIERGAAAVFEASGRHSVDARWFEALAQRPALLKHPKTPAFLTRALDEVLARDYERLTIQLPYREFSSQPIRPNELYVHASHMDETMGRLERLLDAAEQVGDPALYLKLGRRMFLEQRWERDPAGGEHDGLRRMMSTFFRAANRLTAGEPEPLRTEFIALRTKLRPALDALSSEGGGQPWREHGRMRMRAYQAALDGPKAAPPKLGRRGWFTRLIRPAH